MYKALSFALVGITTFSTVSVVSALTPFSLNANMLANQMARQEKINTQNEQSALAQKNKARLNFLRKQKQKTKTTKELRSTQVKKPSFAFPTKIKHKRLTQKISTPIFAAPKQQKKYTPSTHSNVANVDMSRVRNAWLSWNNGLRNSMGLHSFQLRNELNKTALEWSNFSKNRGYITHGRPGDGCVGAYNYVCYNFPVIDRWFKNRGINPKIIARSKHTENIGWGYYKCNSSDCTDALIRSIRKTYDFFYSEKSYNGVHYRSMVHKHFKYIGVDVAVDTSKNRYYLTVHYANDF